MPPKESSDNSRQPDNQVTSFPPAVSTPMVEVRSIPTMGKGLFATRAIPRGTRIICEKPLISIPQIPVTIRSDPYHDIPTFCDVLSVFSSSALTELDQYHQADRHTNTETRTRIRKWYKDAGATDSAGRVLTGKALQNRAKPMIKRYAIFRTNCVQMGVGGVYGCGLFPSYSRMNHSCVPNTHNTYNATLSRLTIHATKDIKADEEITTSYLDSFCRTREQRAQWTRDAWGFVCHCVACTDPTIEVLRQRMFDLDQGLACWRVSKMMTALCGGPTNQTEALEYALQLVGLLELQGLGGVELCKTYRDCSKFSLWNKNIEEALRYAHKEHELELLIVGPETDYLREGMQSASAWIEHLEKIRDGKVETDPDRRGINTLMSMLGL